MSSSLGDYSDGNPDDVDTPPEEDVLQPDSKEITGDLGEGSWSIVSTAGLPSLTSQGDTIQYTINGTTLEAYVDRINEDGQLVFTFDVQPDGSYTFTIVDQIDHLPGDGENALDIDLSGTLQVVVGGSPFTFGPGSMVVTAVDDVPVLTGESVHRVIEEEALDNSQSIGNPDEEDGLEDSDFNTPGQDDSSVVTGSLASLVSIGADEHPLIDQEIPTSGFSFLPEEPATLPSGLDGLESRGDTVQYIVQDAGDGQVLIAYVGTEVPPMSPGGVEDGYEGDARPVFTLLLNPDGEYTFTLWDQIDHLPGAGENAHDLDFSPLINITDFDGDTVNLGDLEGEDPAFVITVTDDVPIQSGAPIMKEVQEDALAPPEDNSTGNSGEGTDLATFTAADLSSVVSDGADEEVSFQLVASGTSGTLSSITSNNEAINWSSDGTKIVGVTAVSGDQVFEVSFIEDDLVFDLDDQVDHTFGVEGDDDDLLSDEGKYIDIGQFVEAVDADGDVVTLEDQLRVDVENDVPEINPDAQQITKEVQEDALRNAEGSETGASDGSTGILDNDELPDGETDVQTFTIDELNSVVNAGADEPLSFSLVASGSTGTTGLTSHGTDITWSSDGSKVTGSLDYNGTIYTVFEVTLDETEGLRFDLDHHVDHTGIDDDQELLGTKINVGQFVVATDKDGDTVNLGEQQLLLIDIENDVPTLAFQAEATVGGEVQEDALGNDEIGMSADNNDDTDNGSVGNLDNDEAVTGGETDTVIFQLSDLLDTAGTATGADDPSWVRYELQDIDEVLAADDLKSGGTAVTYSTSGNTLTASAGTTTVFTFTVDAITGEATFNLNDQLDHSGGDDDQEVLTIGDLGQYVDVTVTDRDFDSTTLNVGNDVILIDVENDVPTLAASGDAVGGAVQEDALDNLQSVGNPDDASDTTIATFGLSGLVADPNSAPGADEDAPITYAIATGGAGGLLGASEQTSNDESIWYYNNAGVLEARAGADSGSADRVVFTFGVEETTGEGTFTLVDQMDHLDDSGDDATLSVDDFGQHVEATITDADLDTDSTSFDGLIGVSVENDVPEGGNPQNVFLANDYDSELPNIQGTGDLNFEIGSDENLQTITLQWVDENVNDNGYIVDNDGIPVTSNGEPLEFATLPDGTIVGRIAGSDTVIFTVTPDQSGGSYTGTYTVELTGPMDGTETQINIPLGSSGGGNAFVRDIEAGTDTDIDGDPDTILIHATAKTGAAKGVGGSAAEVNWSTQGMGVIDAGKIGSNESLILEFLGQDTTPSSVDSGDDGPADPTVRLSYDDMTFRLDHLASGEVAGITVYSGGVGGTVVGYAEISGNDEGSSDASDDLVTISTGITDTQPGSASGTGPDLTIDNLDTDENDWGIAANSSFDTIVFEYEGGEKGDYRVVDVSLTETKEAQDFELTFTAEATDIDGDTATSEEFIVGFEGNGSTIIDGTEENDVIVGSSHDDTIDGGGGDDVIYGGDGDDVIYGGDGNDILVGGDGADELYGEGDNDILVGDIVDFSAQDDDGSFPDIEEDGDADIIDGGGGEDVLIETDADEITTAEASVANIDAEDVVEEGAMADVGGEDVDPLIYLIPPPEDAA